MRLKPTVYMIIILHGNNQVKSREALPSGVRRYLAGDLTPEKLAQITDANDLFSKENIIVIENLLSDPAFKKWDYSGKKTIYLWEGKKLTLTQIKRFKTAKIQEFSLPQVLWKFLNSLNLVDLEQTLKTEPVELVWYLLHRQSSRKGNGELLRKMLAIEYQVKSGRSPVPLRTQLELLIS